MAIPLYQSSAGSHGISKEEGHQESRAPSQLLFSAPRTLTRGRYLVIGHHQGVQASHWENAIVPSWVNEYTHVVSKTDETGALRLRKNLHWLFDHLKVSCQKACVTHFVPGHVVLNDLEEVHPYWPAHKDVIKAVQPEIILTYGNSDISPFWYLYEQSEELGDSWDRLAAGQGNWRCKTFTGTYLGKRVPVIGLPHLNRYTLVGKYHVVEWIESIRTRKI